MIKKNRVEKSVFTDYIKKATVHTAVFTVCTFGLRGIWINRTFAPEIRC